MASTPLEDLIAEAEGHAWFQLYVSGEGPGAVKLAARTRKAGYETLIFTVDVPELGWRPNEARHGFKLPFRIGPRQCIDFALHPEWSLTALLKGKPELGNFKMPGFSFDRTETRAKSDWDTLARLRRGRMGVIFQSFQLIPTMTALENVLVPLEITGTPDAKAAATRALEEVELGHRIGHYPAQMSGGEQQRVALARALAPGPVLLLADEPTGNLDGQTGTHVTDLIFRLAEQHGTTLVLVTHSEALAARCNRQIRIADGRIAA
jgi:ABC-type lipoprotein export system ATPase subunit